MLTNAQSVVYAALPLRLRATSLPDDPDLAHSPRYVRPASTSRRSFVWKCDSRASSGTDKTIRRLPLPTSSSSDCTSTTSSVSTSVFPSASIACLTFLTRITTSRFRLLLRYTRMGWLELGLSAGCLSSNRRRLHIARGPRARFIRKPHHCGGCLLYHTDAQADSQVESVRHGIAWCATCTSSSTRSTARANSLSNSRGAAECDRGSRGMADGLVASVWWLCMLGDGCVFGFRVLRWYK
mmetsp:Transcript_79970/g.213999  ORF Transcript_79970/g.213999 Transcript_79970/m.213999 type:complete len:239 (+) Transcript_79970:710-1426(+)